MMGSQVNFSSWLAETSETLKVEPSSLQFG